MRGWSAAVLLLLVLSLIRADRTHDNRNLSREARLRRNDEDRAPGRRWTSSRNSPYQKVVSSFEQDVPDLREASSQRMETATPEEQDQAKAKNHKRKHWRTRAPSHDLIPSETSSDTRSNADKDEQENESSELSDDEEPEIRSHKPSGAVPRRRTSTNQSKDTEAGENVDAITPNPKKRRRPPTSTTTTTTLAPQTMSDTLYQHFRPLDQDVPQDDIIPFLDFGRKLSPVLPTPSGANSIENRSSVTKLKVRPHQDIKESPSADEDMLQEDMDVSVVKKAIERNSVPRAKLRVREQGISDYYRKRAPPQVRTTENLISSSDSSTASSIQGPKGILVLKKISRHQIHHVPVQKSQDSPPKPITLGREELHHFLKNVELLEEKYKDRVQNSGQRSSALLEETHHSPLTAESSVVKTVIKEAPLSEETTAKQIEIKTTTEATLQKESSSTSEETQKSILTNRTLSEDRGQILNSTHVEKPKILSTAVVTSISVQETLKDTKNLTTKAPQIEVKPTASVLLNTTSNTTETSSTSLEKLKPETTTASFLQPRNPTTPKQTNTSAFIGSPGEPITTPINVKSETSLRSRDIYKPKAIPPGAKIPHLPRQIPFLSNTSRSIASPVTPSPTSPSPNSTLTSHITSTTTVASTTKLSSTITSTITTPSTSTLRAKSTPKVKLVPIPIPEEIPYIEISKEVKNVKNEDETKTTTEIQTRVKVTTSTTEDTSQVKNSRTDVLQTPSSTQNQNQPIPTSSKVYEEEPLETESVPPPRYDESSENLTFVPAQAPEDDPEDQFPIYFTTLPTITKPVVDTRPETEAAVIPQRKNTTSPRVGADWAKVGVADKEVEVVLPEPLGAGAYILAGLGVVPILIGALIGAKILVAHNKKKVLDESEYSSEYNRSPLGNATASPLPTKLPRIPTHVNWNETEKSPPALPPPLPPPPSNNPVNLSSSSARWEFPREKLRLQTLLGQGNFGQVWKAEADDIAGHEGLTRLVAVKSVKESANTREREDLLRELGILQELGSHPNVVTLLGCCTEKEPIYLIMEYVMYGKLLSFLRDSRSRAHYYNFSDAGDALSSRDLTVFGYCVARGMDYLTNKSIIHRDMAARNVLVDHNKLCKIADFGMSRNVRDTGQIYEQRQSKGALPIRWMAPESLAFSLFTHKTDVWSFGILMWEIVTLGSTPYATMGAREVMRRVQDGYRLEKPSHCRSELFRLIAQCWHSEPSKRPTFSELKAELGVLLSDSTHNGSLVDLESLAEEMRRDTLHRHH